MPSYELVRIEVAGVVTVRDDAGVVVDELRSPAVPCFTEEHLLTYRAKALEEVAAKNLEANGNRAQRRARARRKPAGDG